MRDEQARTSLRQALYDLRKNLGTAAGGPCATEGETVSLDPAAVELDVATFTGIAGEETPEALEQAALLYRGDLLEGFSVDEEPFEAWLMEERERLRELAMEALARATLPSAQDRCPRRGSPNRAPALGARSPPGAGAPHAHAAAMRSWVSARPRFVSISSA